jgi:thiol peroxidase
MWKHVILVIVCMSVVFIMNCGKQEDMETTNESVQPGTEVTFQGKPYTLIGTPIQIGEPLPPVKLVDASLEERDLSKERGSVLFLSVVTSIDTPVCEEQTHYLGEEGDRLVPEVSRIVISRDTPFAQKRFADAADLQDLQYFSDYKKGAFGKATGLLMDGLMLLSRAVIVVDQDGIIRYIQVVPEITLLPDMETAFNRALEIAKK